jgi:hypothetical protein
MPQQPLHMFNAACIQRCMYSMLHVFHAARSVRRTQARETRIHAGEMPFIAITQVGAFGLNT